MEFEFDFEDKIGKFPEYEEIFKKVYEFLLKKLCKPIYHILSLSLIDEEESLYTNSAGAIVKTILLHNSNAIEKEVTLNIDGVTFLFRLSTKETKILNSPLIINSFKAKGAGINIHISGIQL